MRQLPEEAGPGKPLLLEAEFEETAEIVTGFGRLGLSAESLAKTAAHRMAGYLASSAFAGPDLADPLLLPFALAGGGAFTTVKPSQHALFHRSDLSLLHRPPDGHRPGRARPASVSARPRDRVRDHPCGHNPRLRADLRSRPTRFVAEAALRAAIDLRHSRAASSALCMTAFRTGSGGVDSSCVCHRLSANPVRLRRRSNGSISSPML